MVTMLYAIADTLLKVTLNTNKTGHHVTRNNWYIFENGLKHIPITLVTMLYIITDILLKVPLSTNKYSNHGIRYNWQIVECGVKQ
jgi:hypothetical protein